MMQLQWKREWTTPSVVGVISFGVGIGVGYIFATYRNKRNPDPNWGIREKVDEIKETVDETQEDVTQLHFKLDETKEGIDRNSDQTRYLHNMIINEENKENESPRSRSDEVVAEINKSLTNHPTNPRFTMESNSIFSPEQIDPIEWDYDEEMKSRSPDHPYIIHRDEYYGDEKEYDNQTTLTYYQGDDVLCDTDDSPIYNYKAIVGDLIFGKGSGDPSIVHVRNEKLEAEYEVLLDHGSYQIEVLGADYETAIGNKKAFLHRFRQENEAE